MIARTSPSPHISIVSPVYRAEKIIPELVKRIDLAVSKITDNYEIILVEDCGPDNSWQVIEQVALTNPRVKGYQFSRNFGQHYAITCGLDHANGDWVVVMDCDLQDQPEEIRKLYNKAIEGFDIVFARRENRVDGFLKKLGSKLFYSLFSYLSGIKQDRTIANFGIYSKKAIESVNKMREPMRAFSPMVRWVGFSKSSINVEHSTRFEGKSSYNLSRLIELALDISLAYSDKPLRLTIKFGFIISLISFVFAVVLIVRYYFGYIKVGGYTSLMVSIWFLSGLVIMILGIIGLYISKIFDGVKNRPLYIIDKITNFKM
jgi:glycosyltransferase involved in cell wall biosynthesis